MQGYTLMVREALAQMAEPPTHVFVQAGVGGVAAAVAGHLAILLGDKRPTFIVVDPARAACLYESAKANKPVRIAHGEPTVMAMLECYEPSRLAWRVLSHVADGFMTVDEDDAVSIMRRLARPVAGDPAIVSGESGGVGLAGLVKICQHRELRDRLGLDKAARVLVINTEGATDPKMYEELVGLTPADLLKEIGKGEGGL
jgi:diaminopropionate ammonia-lyase